MLNIPAGIATILGPTLGGIITDSSLTWRFLFWLTVVIAAVAFALLLWGLPKQAAKTGKANIDFAGIVLLTIAAATMIIGFSWAGSTYAWTSIQVIAMLGFSISMWALFLRQEGKTAEPILDPEVLTNRTFLTAAVAGFLSFFGLLGIMMYFTLFLQGVQGLSATVSGTIITPFGAIMAFMGVPAGILLARTKKYKWMYIAGYALLTAMMFVMWKFNVATPIWVSVLVTSLAGLGLGAIPTVNTLVVQFALPKRLMGIAIGAIFFFVMMGFAIAPAILGSFMNSSYAQSLQQNLPTALAEKADPAMMQSLLSNSRVLLTPDAMTSLHATLAEYGDAALFDQTVAAIRIALEYSLQNVFLLGAITMLAAFLLIVTIPEVSLDIEVQDKKAPAAN
jgi:MFS family permease